MPGPKTFTPSLYDWRGQRKYLTRSQSLRFIEVAGQQPFDRCVFAWLMISTGCRISEGTALTPFQIDAEDRVVVFRTLKRRQTHFRPVPVQSSPF
ncbi:hypothetical protein [Rhodospirillum sp. A1_3_36]|uniref:hypothetical protein n=1 Tax=Rhodospirillum sp. A1_3_36 TaxID=3391666 RepID=UPI0039A50C29